MTELDQALGPRQYTTNGFTYLTAADFTGDYTPPEPEAVIRVAQMLGRLLGLPEYTVCGDKTREDLRKCAKKLLRNGRGDLEGVLELEAASREDGYLAKSLQMSQSPYGLVPKLATLYDRRRAALRHDDQADRDEYLRYASP